MQAEALQEGSTTYGSSLLDLRWHQAADQLRILGCWFQFEVAPERGRRLGLLLEVAQHEAFRAEKLRRRARHRFRLPVRLQRPVQVVLVVAQPVDLALEVGE